MQNIIIIQSEIQNARKGIFSPIDPVKANPGNCISNNHIIYKNSGKRQIFQSAFKITNLFPLNICLPLWLSQLADLRIPS